MISNKRLKFLITTVMILMWSIHADSKSGQLSFKAGTWSYDVTGTDSDQGSTSGLGAYSAELGYSFLEPFLFTFGFNLILSDIISGSSGYGLDIGLRWYPITSTGTSGDQSGNVEIFSQDQLRPYIGVAMRQRIFGLSTSTSYLGPGLTVGADYSLGPRWFLNAEARYDILYGHSGAVANQVNLLFGGGVEF